MTRANNSDARDYLPSTERETSGTFATTTEPPPTRLERAFAGVDPLATALGSLAVWLAVSGRNVKRRAKRWELRARRAEAENQDLEWRLRVATSVASGSGPPEPPRAPKPPPSTPSPSQAPSTPSTVDTRDVIIEGLRMETEALKAALAQARAEAQRVSRDDVP